MISIVLALVVGIVLGYAAKQRQDLIEAHDRIECLLIENRDLSVANQELRAEGNAHVSIIEMVVAEVERLS